MTRRDRLVMHGLRLQDFTALFGVEAPLELAGVLAEQDLTQPYGQIYGVHHLRWMSFDPTTQHGVNSMEPHVLVFSLVFDGNLDDVLLALVEQKRQPLLDVLRHCRGFDPNLPLVQFLKRFATPSGYLFRHIGPIESDGAPEPDATLAEIEDACEVQRRFERFYAEHAGRLSASALRARFKEEFGAVAFPFPLTEFERRDEAEEAWIRRMVDVGKKLQESNARKSSDQLVRRAAHAKGHGLLRARFDVVDSPYAIGLFAEVKSYAAVVRPSNASSGVHNDRSPDAHGLALSIEVPKDQPIAGKLPQFLVPPEQAGFGRQDFVLMDVPVFAAPNIRRFAMWFKTFNNDTLTLKLAGLLGLSLGPGGFREAAIFLRTLLGRVRHPLAPVYHSTTAYLLGSEHVAKYSIEPVDVPKRTGKGTLSEQLAESLRTRSIELRFYLHVLGESQPPKGTSLAEAVEDATRDWSKLGARKIHVANIHIGPDTPTSDERLLAAERARFSPWHALVEHRPLGSLNRARLAAYPASQQYRAAGLAPPLSYAFAHAAE